MFGDYIDAVVSEYRAMVSSKRIALNLLKPTPAKVKKECLAVCKARFRKADERMLSALFGYAENQQGYYAAIKRCHIDKFRPLINFLNGQSKKTEDNNIELLAWLIDFKDRPFDDRKKYNGETQAWEASETPGGFEEGAIEDDLQPATGDQHEDHPAVLKPVTKERKSRRALLIAALIITLFAGTAGYINLVKSASGSMTQSSDSCMHWDKSGYVKTPCDNNDRAVNPIALNQNLVSQFKRITRPDTITYPSIGRVWYTKINGDIEFYTAMGYHPVYTGRQLKPITKYIIDKYVRGKTADGNDPSTQTAYRSSKPTNWELYGQCQGTTKAKTRCLHSAGPDGYCWQHKDQGR